MRKRIPIFVCSVALFWSAAMVLSQDQAAAPTHKDGDTWQFNISRKGGAVSSTELNDGTYELAFIQGNVKLFEVSGNQKNEIEAKADGGPTQALLSLVGKSEQRPDLKFPLTIGQKWSYEYQTRPAGSRQDQRRSVEITVVGMEKVTTPAGAFDAYKLVKAKAGQPAEVGEEAEIQSRTSSIQKPVASLRGRAKARVRGQTSRLN